MWIEPKGYKKVGALLAEVRDGTGLTQVALAKRLGKPQSFVSSYERGQRRIDLLEFLQIAEAVGVDAVALFRKIARTI